ncbi:MAG: hypothetical protein GY725_02190 [bacterium]|nr:hypothetical protein [bacterium]
MKSCGLMKPWLCVVLPFLLLSSGCEPAAVETPGDESESAEQNPIEKYANPREPAELWPSVLKQRDVIRAAVENPKLWHDDLAQLEKDIMSLLELVTEISAYSRANPDLAKFPEVARSVGDVRVAVLPIRSAAAAARPEMFGDSPRDLDQALALLEKRFPEGYFSESISDRSDYARPKSR